MDPVKIVLVIIALVAIAFAILMVLRKRRSERLQGKFGPEYEHEVDRAGDRKRAERELEAREKRLAKIEIRRLRPDERNRFAEDWNRTQSRFVDEPSKAVDEAENLVTQVMNARGYPMGDFEQRAADISVHYPKVVSNYRSARDIAAKNRSGESTTEELRQAMVYYRELFEDLLETDKPAPREEVRAAEKAAERGPR